MHLASTAHADWSFTEDSKGKILLFKNKFYIPLALRNDIVCEYHDNRGHFGVKRTLDMLRRHFYFERMSDYVYKYVRKCEYCAR